jgi:hypothetical protein
VSALALVGAQNILYMKILGSGIAFKICLSFKRCSIRCLSLIRSTSAVTPGKGSVTSTPCDNFYFSLMKAVSIEEMLKVQCRGGILQHIQHSKLWSAKDHYGASGLGVLTGLASGATPRDSVPRRLAFWLFRREGVLKSSLFHPTPRRAAGEICLKEGT